MKFYTMRLPANERRSLLSVFLIIILCSGCATYKSQYVKEAISIQHGDKEIASTLFLVGGLGNHPDQLLLNQLSKELQAGGSSTNLLLLGDNISDEGEYDTYQGMQHLANLVKDNKGNTFFIPGDYEWEEHTPLDGIEMLINSGQNAKNIFVSKNGCPLEQRTLSDELDLILIDSQWYLQDWDQSEDVNINCPDIKARRRFVEELEGMIRDAKGKNLIIAMHHPIFSNGELAGNKGFAAHMTPIPIIGSAGIGLEQLAGVNTKSTAYPRYRSLVVQVSSLAQQFERVTVVSGHEQSLQFLQSNKVSQIISGAMGESSRTKKGHGTISAIGGKLDYQGVFTSGEPGYAKLVYYMDGSSQVFFYTKDQVNTPSVFEVEKAFPIQQSYEVTSTVNSPNTVATILNSADTRKGPIYTTLWGKNNRAVYAQPISAPNGMLDTLYGGLSVKKEGGGHQSNNLRLIDQEGKEYAMRGLEKEGLRFLQYSIKGIAYDPESYEDTNVEKFVNDFFTTSHPYMQLIIPEMAAAAHINHADTRLFYIPEQESLGPLNPAYGNALYFIEQRPSDEHNDFEGYNRIRKYQNDPITDFVSTTNMLKKLRADEKYSIDQAAYIRARIFDMLIGDWDRHEDNWRWVEHSQADGKKVFLPIPRDRDGAFAKYDGLGLDFIQMLMPDTRFWQTYGENIKSIKWFNGEVFDLDNALLREFDLSVWKHEAQVIQKGLTNQVLDEAFQRLPVEIREEAIEFYKPIILKRLENLERFATSYAKFQAKTVVVHATDQADNISITRQENGTTLITIDQQTGSNSGGPFFQQVYTPEHVNEIWVYGLNHNDTFEVKGQGKATIMLRLIGGYGDENFIIHNNRRLKIYDYKHENNSFEGAKSPRKQLSEQYKVNTFHYRHFLKSNNVVYPGIGFGNDKGISVGFTDIYTKNGFNGNPFKQQHTLSANYYTGLSAIELNLSSEFANIFPDINFDMDAYFTSQGFARNFFGFGNNSPNQQNDISNEFNQVETRQLRLYPGLTYKVFKLGPEFESFRVTRNPSRIGTEENLQSAVFESQEYVGAKLAIAYSNINSLGYPTKGFSFNFSGGWKINIADKDNNFGYVDASLGIDQKLVRSENLILSSQISGRAIVGNNFYFYHGASVGQNRGLRGYRNNRYTGKHSFSHSSDLRLRLLKINTNILPITMGLYGGFDYGRVWMNQNDSSTWHHSQGGGIWLGGMNSLTLKLGYFTSQDGSMLNIRLGFGF